MKTLSLDASTTSTGYAIFDTGVLVEYGVIRPSKQMYPIDRICEIYFKIKDIIKENKIKEVCIEDVPLGSSINKRVAENLLLLQGSIMALCFEKKIGFIQMEPSNWRRLCGLNSSNRRDVQKENAINMVNKMFGFNFEWRNAKYDSITGNSDVCEAILIGVAGKNRKDL